MARKQEQPLFANVSNIDERTIQESRFLFSLWQSHLTFAEFRVLDAYLMQLNRYSLKKRCVIFEYGDIQCLLGSSGINEYELEETLRKLIGYTLKSNTKHGFVLLNLFEMADVQQRGKQWRVELTCTEAIMDYIFNIENFDYLRYKLHCISSLSSRYACIMLLYLEANRHRQTWEVSIQELKDILDCEEDAYREFKHFNNLVLRKVHKELEIARYRYSYATIKKGRLVIAIKFTLELLPGFGNRDKNQITIEQLLQEESAQQAAPS